MKLEDLKKLLKPQFVQQGNQILLYVPVLPEDGSIEFGPNYIVSYPVAIIVGNIKPPKPNQGKVVYTAVGLGEISPAAKNHSWQQAYAVCKNVGHGQNTS